MRRTATSGIAGLAAAAALLLAPGDAAAQVGGTVIRVLPPMVPGLSVPSLDLAAPWDPLGVLGPPSPIGPSPFAAPARAGLVQASDIVVIPALFEDSPEPHVSADEVRDILFDPDAPGTFVAFYEEASRGLVSPTGVVTPWVRTDVTLLEASGSSNGHGYTNGTRRIDYIVAAIELADAHVDYAQFDNDGPDGVPNSGDDDGFLDVLVVEFLEVAGSCGGPAIWPHYGGFPGDHATDDPAAGGGTIRVKTYLTQGVTDCSGESPQGPNVIAHEYGHRLGLPDWYQAVGGIEPDKRHWNVGCFGLMGGGSWGCGSGPLPLSFGPVHFTAYSKWFLGWMEADLVEGVIEEEFVLEPAQTTGRALRISLDPGGTESLWIEYRPLIGFDAQLPAGGVLVYHFDASWNQRNVPGGLPPAKPLHLVEADGDHALRKVAALGGDRGVATDVFGIEGRTGPYSSDVGPVRLLRHEGQPVPVTIHSVVVDGEVARVVLSVSPQPTLVASEPAAGARALESGPLAELRLAGGALPYTVTDQDPDADFTVTMAGNDGVVTGEAFLPGRLELSLRVEDALGTVTEEVIVVEVADAEGVDVGSLVDALLGVAGAAESHERYLDAQGNDNGRADVGDLRAWLRRTGQL